jgi:hypothetical protein
MQRRTSSRPRRLGPIRTLATALCLGGLGAATIVASAAASAPPAPLGHLSSITQVGDGVQIVGWALDPSTSAPINVDIWVDGQRTRVLAQRHRGYLGGYHDGLQHGFTVHLAEPAGAHNICVHAVGSPSADGITQLGCRAMTLDYDPLGVISSVVQTPGHLTVRGWAYDADQPTVPITVAFRLGPSAVAVGVANQVVASLATSHPQAGADHGFTLTAAVPEGSHYLCVKAYNVGLGANHTIDCRSRTVSYSPAGAISTLTQAPGGIHLTGWAADPDTSAAINVRITADGATLGTTTAQSSGVRADHSFVKTYRLPDADHLAPGRHRVCAIGINAGAYGENREVACQTISLNYNPRAAIDSVTQDSPGALVTGWATDPDTTAPVDVRISGDGTRLAVVRASRSGATHSGHRFSAVVPLTNGAHTVCVVAVNVDFGSGNSAPACSTVNLNFDPYGTFESVARAAGSTNIVATGWTIDPDTTAPISVRVTVDGQPAGSGPANIRRTDVAAKHPGAGVDHGFAVSVPADSGEHKVCVVAVNVLGGNHNRSLGCRTMIAVHPVAPSAPQQVTAIAGYGGASVSWTPPAHDGGAPWTSYRVTASPSGLSVVVGNTSTSATIVGLRPKTSYRFTVTAHNVAGNSAGQASAAVTTQAAPPPQTTPAPISTSRYIRNISNASSADLATMRREGVADARANPSGHGYLILLDIGGQDQADHGVVLSAGVRFVSYAALEANLEAYVDGYASAQKPSAPVVIALGTNNDMDVTAASGATWANTIVDPVASHAAKYTGITIAGADDMEPGFRATYRQTRSWLAGFLGATSAPFVFNGSADGCSWTSANAGCNNGWRMGGMYHLAAGANPIRIINLPQIYNTTMAQQWKYISLTGVDNHMPQIDFGGALTEYTACQQDGGCGSLTGRSAWTQLWNQLHSTTQLRLSSLPYSTDLRIDN